LILEAERFLKERRYVDAMSLYDGISESGCVSGIGPGDLRASNHTLTEVTLTPNPNPQP